MSKDGEIKIYSTFDGKARETCLKNANGCGNFRELVTGIGEGALQWLRTPPDELEEVYAQLPFSIHDVVSADSKYYCDGPIEDEASGEVHCGLAVATSIYNIDGKSLATLNFESDEVIDPNIND